MNPSSEWKIGKERNFKSAYRRLTVVGISLTAVTMLVAAALPPGQNVLRFVSSSLTEL